MKMQLFFTAVLAVGVLSAGSALAITNGDFETGDLTGWNTLDWAGAVDLEIESTTPLAGSHSATTTADATVRAITQDTGPFTSFDYNMLFRIDDNTGSRAMDWSLGDTAGGTAGGSTRFKVDFDGIFSIGINGDIDGGWADLNGGPFLPTTGTTYRWNIVGSGYDGTSSASFDVRIFEGATEVFTSLANTFDTNVGNPIQSVNFIRGGNWVPGGYTVDDVSISGVPEPSSVALLAFGLVGLASRRRRS